MDNYIWVMQSPDGRQLVAVDPGDADPVLQLCQKEGALLTDILITHHHADHVGGIGKLRQAFPAVRVHGPALEKITGVDHPLGQGDTVSISGLEGAFTVLDIPGHTAGHIAYSLPTARWLFCGDTLFAAGCGRLFEGTAQQMFDSLQKLGSLPADTQVFCTHEYTQSNLAFACVAEPENADIRARASEVAARRSLGLSTLPSTLELEWKTNPFLRAGDASRLAQLRRQKDVF